jgi:CheY-like chemotaxis protein
LAVLAVTVEGGGLRLRELGVGIVQRAVGIYLDLAYGGSGGPRRMPNLSLPQDASADRVLELFHKEVVADGDSERRVRYSLRLGNRNYPFMKLVLQEHLIDGEYIFAVDTHDEMEIRPDFPDYEAWMAVRRFNRKLKAEIEAQIASEGLPTAASLKDVAARRRGGVKADAPAQTILVVDDEEDLADCVESLLVARGFAVVKAFDGRNGLRMAERTRPDLIILDYELPEMDGIEVIAALRAVPATRKIPVLLTTASKIGVEDIQKAEGFLAKPYGEQLLYAVVQRLLPQHDPKK